MIASPARRWLRQIALGLPLVSVAPVFGGCCFDPSAPGGVFGGSTGNEETPPELNFPPCPPDPVSATFVLTPDQAARVTQPDGGTEPSACGSLCNELQLAAGGETRNGISCARTVSAESTSILCEWQRLCSGGRAPAGLRNAHAATTSSAVGAFLARSAHLESASVDAFHDLASELSLHGAPRAAIRGARRAAEDECRHARSVARLARRHGAHVMPVERVAVEPRSLRLLAEDNAIEGCVREAHAALTAAHQATHAADLEVRGVYRTIARDEARHALWSFALHEWSSAALGARASRALEDTRREALATWTTDLEQERPAPMRRALGLPDAERALSLVRALT